MPSVIEDKYRINTLLMRTNNLMQCKILVVSSESEARSDMRESREMEEVTWEWRRFNKGGVGWDERVAFPTDSFIEERGH